jgi:hypothetical protein
MARAQGARAQMALAFEAPHGTPASGLVRMPNNRSRMPSSAPSPAWVEPVGSSAAFSASPGAVESEVTLAFMEVGGERCACAYREHQGFGLSTKIERHDLTPHPRARRPGKEAMQRGTRLREAGCLCAIANKQGNPR